MKTTLRAALLTASISVLLLPKAQRALAADAEVSVLCSNGFKAAMEKLQPEYEHSLGIKMNVTFGTSAKIKGAIEGGEAFDLAILTSPVIADLSKDGKIAAGTAVNIASSGIGMAVRAGTPKPDVSTPAAVKQTLLKAKSIAYVKEGASTPALVGMFNTLGISDEVQKKVLYQPGADQNMASVANGQAELSFGLVSEIVPVPGVQLAGPLLPEFQRPITMSAGIGSSTKNRKAVEKIVKSLTSAASAPTIQATGMDPVAKKK
jgi:molybdate transport system substrate-binding protein